MNSSLISCLLFPLALVATNATVAAPAAAPSSTMESNA